MTSTLLLTALLMGLAGGPHCMAMCAAPCAAVVKASTGADGRATLPLVLFQTGRLLGYAALGAVAAASVQALGWMTTQSAAVRPLWVLMHVAAMLAGLVLLIQARQPLWLDDAARRLWARVQALQARTSGAAPLVIGALWTFMPCGLLYSALLVAALAGSAAQGAATMAAFAVGSGVVLAIAPWLLLRLRGGKTGQWALRLAGLALIATAGFALYMDVMHDQAPWCEVR